MSCRSSSVEWDAENAQVRLGVDDVQDAHPLDALNEDGGATVWQAQDTADLGGGPTE